MLVTRLKEITTEAEALRAELQAEEAQAKAITSPQVAYETFKAELKSNSQTPEGREKIKAAIRDIVESIKFASKDCYTITFKGGKSLEVWMADGTFKFEAARDLGPVMVP